MRFEEDFQNHTANGIKSAEANFREKVAGRQVPWSRHCRSGFITTEEYELIDKYDKKPEPEKRAIFLNEGERLSRFFVDFLNKVADLETVQYVLYLINEIISIEPKALAQFAKLSKEDDPEYPLMTFFRMTGREDNNAYVNLLTGRIMGNLMSVTAPQKKDLERFVNWTLPLLRKTESREVEVALIALQPFFLKEDNRVLFISLNGPEHLTDILSVQSTSSTPVLSLLYEALYAFWLLSYNESFVKWVSGKHVISNLVSIIKAITKEKIVRLAISSLRNLLGHGDNNEEMIECGFVRMLNFLSNKKWGDQDIVDDISTLSETLSQDIARMSSFDKYRAEVLSKELEWSPVHKSEKFWKENAVRFEENSHNVLKFLHLILQKSDNPLHISIACHDLGEFVRFHPRGKIIIETLGIKTDIMKLMTNPNEEVKKQALFALQKMMINNWEYLSSK
ncbi:hypothetical protein SAMD00019534_121940 [Acytostelium subglobosum LB1]|uniref:hypothetical protein n=1 Tax=Acytostelium subglobosum LB1 TaxID=1410327 RepID=UPI000645235B|nr:hypothetical protein SAMD00019534_121940 [Acytostelium subglobosum LB1]GAM29018.1 hypothetical protein SAMD00019534_121940 [Acytostelium subglobosum LB1]|eukprot:XP_012748024.1 hypothetical protein SAMD00019534_121940 [Acytostelium subglobosum LB1]